MTGVGKLTEKQKVECLLCSLPVPKYMDPSFTL